MKKEEWKIYPDFANGKYRVSSEGRIKVIYKNGSTKILKANVTPFGYLRIQLCYAVGPRTLLHKNIFVHRLVAACFIPNPDGKKHVNHKNSNRIDCRVENLEWASRSENMKHAFSEGFKTHVGENNTRAKLTNEQVTEIFNMEGTLSEIAKKYNLGTSAVHRIKKGVSWSHIKR